MKRDKPFKHIGLRTVESEEVKILIDDESKYLMNPNGRPRKGHSITEWFKGMLNSNPDVKEKLGKAIFRKALEGDMNAIKLIWSYMDGLPQANVDITSGGQSLKGLIKLE